MRHNVLRGALLTTFIVLLFSSAGITQTAKADNGRKKSTSTGDIRLHKLQSKIFNNSRMIRVLVPPGYDKNPSKKYPVLYLNDGQNLFDVLHSQHNPMEWKVDETFHDLLSSGKIDPLIIVGIDNAGKRMRPNEYLPYPDKYLSPPVPNPQGARYPDFLTNEVMPFVEKEYRIRKGAKNTGLGGSSYGALVTLYTVIQKPNVFGKVLLESPSFYVQQAQVLKSAKKSGSFPEKIFLGVGTNEMGRKNCKPKDPPGEAADDVGKLVEILFSKKIYSDRVSLFIESCAIHNEDAWARRFPSALKFLYGKKKE